MDPENEEPLDLTARDAITKVRYAADITNDALKVVIDAAVAGAKVVDLCNLGDEAVKAGAAKLYKDKKVDKGSAFPTTIAINDCAGNFSPLKSDTSSVLSEGDLVKIDLGAHIDGWPAVVTHTLCVGGPAKGKAGDVLAAAQTAADAVHRLLKKGADSKKVTEVVEAIAKDFGVNPVNGTQSNDMARFVLHGNLGIPNKDNKEVKPFTVAENNLFSIDIVMSTGEGRVSERAERTTVYRRIVEEQYSLKGKAAREVHHFIHKNFASFPFTTRAFDSGFESAATGLLGLKEMIEHGLVEPYPVIYEKAGEYVARVKFTVMVLGSGTTKINGAPNHPVETEKKVESDIAKDALARSFKLNKKKKKSTGATVNVVKEGDAVPESSGKEAA